MKFLLLDHWPYLLHGRGAERRRARLLSLIPRLPPLQSREPFQGEAHMMCGRRQLDMGIWSSWSFMRHLPGFRLYVHSDGSLDEPAMNEWRRIIPRVVFTSREEREERARAALQDRHPLLFKWRGTHLYSAKLLDFHLYGEGDRLLAMDSDVLCFAPPVEVLGAFGGPRPALRWNEDVRTSYPADVRKLRQLTGVAIPERFNAGFLVSKRFGDEDFGFFNSALSALAAAGIDLRHHWLEQLLYAMSVARHESASPFPATYSVAPGRTAADAITRHYVGVLKIRPRFYLEGVPRIVNQAGLAA